MILTINSEDGTVKTVFVDDVDEAAEAIEEMTGYDSEFIKEELEDFGSFEDAEAEYVLGEGEEE